MNSEQALKQRVANARTFLFAPGHRPERFEKALESRADVVVLDLEDSVPADEKAAARAAIAGEWRNLQRFEVPLVVRMNSPAVEAGRQDLAWLQSLGLVAAVMVPKAESAEQLTQVYTRLIAVSLLPIVESAAGYFALRAVAAAPGVLRLVIGHIDFMADSAIECDSEQSQLDPLRFGVSMATRVNRLFPGVDGVTVEIGDDVRLREDVSRGLRFGLTGKLCVHPRQVGVVHQAMRPSDERLDWAQRVLAANSAAKGTATQVDGKMVDLPVVLQAQRLLARAARPSDPI
jgi:citrate lyase subunit beta / citryl-CoA lyase